MQKIKGLLLKDLLELKAYKKNLIFSVILYIGIIILNYDSEDIVLVGTAMIAFLFSVYAMATFNYDEKAKTDRYVLTFPLSRKEIVLSKYIFMSISMISGLIVGYLIGFILYLLNIISIPSFSNYISSVLGFVLALSIMQSIQIPCIYKYGAEKGRLQIYLIMMGVVLLIGLLYLLFPNISITVPNILEFLMPIILLVLSLFNYFISYKISLKIYSHKEI